MEVSKKAIETAEVWIPGKLSPEEQRVRDDVDLVMGVFDEYQAEKEAARLREEEEANRVRFGDNRKGRRRSAQTAHTKTVPPIPVRAKKRHTKNKQAAKSRQKNR